MSPSSFGAESFSSATAVGVRSGRERNCWVPPGTTLASDSFPGPICLAGCSIRKWNLPSPTPRTFRCVVTATVSPGSNGLTATKLAPRPSESASTRPSWSPGARAHDLDVVDPRGIDVAEADLGAGHRVPAPGDREHADSATVVPGVGRRRQRVVGGQRRGWSLGLVAPAGRQRERREQAARDGRPFGQPDVHRHAAGRRSLRSHAPRSRVGSYGKQPDSVERSTRNGGCRAPRRGLPQPRISSAADRVLSVAVAGPPRATSAHR